MSRLSLHLVFPDKQAIFRAVLYDFEARINKKVRTGLDDHATVADKFGFVVEMWTVRPFKLDHDAPPIPVSVLQQR